jgi:beta-glucosidase
MGLMEWRIGLAVAIVAGALVGVLPQARGVGAAAALPSGAGGPGDEGGTRCTASSFSLEPMARAQSQARNMLGRMTLEQEVTLMDGVGQDTAPSGTIGATAAIPSLGIPAINQQDGPGGVGDGVTGVTQLPAPEALAATFDPVAAACYGQVIGTEARGKGINLVYGPTVNIVRVPQWGRAFESLGEDPTLTGAVASAEVDGIQRSGTMAQVKHFAVYNQETYRNSPADDAIVGAKALQEIYLRAWDEIVQADPSSVMCSYSTINGTDACQDKTLIGGYLDTTLHFGGFVGSDYEATHSTVAAVDAGLDQEQPLSTQLGPALVAAVRNGQVSRSIVDDAALRILTEMYRFRLFTDDTTGSIDDDVTTTADTRVSNEIAEEGTTLLKNAGHTLPLDGTGQGGIAVIGPAAQAAPTSVGGGSATVTAADVVSPLAGIRDVVGGRGSVSYTAGLPAPSAFTAVPSADMIPSPSAACGTSSETATLTAPETGTYEFAYTEADDYLPVTLSINGKELVGNPGTPPYSTYTGTVHLTAGRSYALSGPVGKLTWVTPSQITQSIGEAVAAARSASTAIVVVGDDQESEAVDRITLALPSDQDALVRAVAGANKHTIVVLDAGGPVTMPWLNEVSSVLDAWYPGQTDGTALAAVLFGRIDPSGHLPMTFPTAMAHDPVSTPAQFPGVDGDVRYSEGVDVGYRWYEATGTKPLFPFGYGLSYTTFGYSAPHVRVADDDGRPVVTATVRVTDTGPRSGADVAQLYLGQPAPTANPPRQLEAFQRVSLRPGQSRTVTFVLRGLQLAYYDTGARSWRIADGRYRIWMGDSSALANLAARVTFGIARAVTVSAA